MSFPFDPQQGLIITALCAEGQDCCSYRDAVVESFQQVGCLHSADYDSFFATANDRGKLFKGKKMPSLFQERLFAKSLLGFICVINSYCFAEDTGQSSQRMPEGIDRGRSIIATLQDEVFAKLAYSQEELSLLKEDFRKDYFKSVEPRLKDVSRYISGSAIHWVDVEWDGVEELVFWTEGLSPGWNIKEALFIVKVPQEDNSEKTSPTIMLFCALDDPFPSTTSKGYRYVRFTPYPNATLGTNAFVRAVFSYVSLGASGSAFGHLSIEYNKYEDKVEINKFATPFPFIIEKDVFK